MIDGSDLPFRDKTVLLWSLTREDTQYGYPKRSLKGHSHFVQDVVISSDGQFALTGSWDHTLRLWDLHTGQTTRRFIGHTKDVLSVAFSMDNRQVHPPLLIWAHGSVKVAARPCHEVEQHTAVAGARRLFPRPPIPYHINRTMAVGTFALKYDQCLTC